MVYINFAVVVSIMIIAVVVVVVVDVVAGGGGSQLIVEEERDLESNSPVEIRLSLDGVLTDTFPRRLP